MTQVFITTNGLAERWAINRATVYKWMDEGRIPQPIRIGGGDSRWRLDDIIAFENAQDVRPRAEVAAIVQALLAPPIHVAMILRGETLREWLQLYQAGRDGCKTDAERAEFFLKMLPDTLAPLMKLAANRHLGDAACIAAVSMLSLALGEHAMVAELVPLFAVGISKQGDVVAYLQRLMVRIREAREHRLSLPAIWLRESQLLFGRLASAAADDLEMKQAVDAVLGDGVLIK